MKINNKKLINYNYNVYIIYFIIKKNYFYLIIYKEMKFKIIHFPPPNPSNNSFMSNSQFPSLSKCLIKV